MKLNVISGRIPAGAIDYMPEMTREAIDTIMKSHPLMRFLEFHPMIGDAEYVENANVTTGGVGRVKGNDFTGETKSRDYQAPALKIFGDSKSIDQAEQRRGKDMNDFSLRVLRSLARSVALNFAAKIIHGTTSTSMWDGLVALRPTSQKVTLATNGAVVPLGNDNTNRGLQQAIFESLDKAIGKVVGGADGILLNSSLHSRITNIYKEAFTFPENAQGVGVPVPYYNGIPFIPMGYDGAGNEILPPTESCGTATTCTSIIVASFAEGDRLSIASNTGFGVTYGKVGEKYRMTLEGDFVPTLFDNRSLSYVEGIKLA